MPARASRDPSRSRRTAARRPTRSRSAPPRPPRWCGLSKARPITPRPGSALVAERRSGPPVSSPTRSSPWAASSRRRPALARVARRPGTHDELWPFVVHASNRYGLYWGDPVETDGALDRTWAEHGEQLVAGSTAQVLLTSDAADLALLLGQLSRAEAALDGVPRATPGSPCRGLGSRCWAATRSTHCCSSSRASAAAAPSGTGSSTWPCCGRRRTRARSRGRRHRIPVRAPSIRPTSPA